MGPMTAWEREMTLIEVVILTAAACQNGRRRLEYLNMDQLIDTTAKWRHELGLSHVLPFAERGMVSYRIQRLWSLGYLEMVGSGFKISVVGLDFLRKVRSLISFVDRELIGVV